MGHVFSASATGLRRYCLHSSQQISQGMLAHVRALSILITTSNLVSSARIGAPETVEIIRFPGFCFGSFRLSVPSRYPPFGHLWPRPAARVTYRNRRFRKRLRAFARRVFVIEVRPRPMCPVSGPIRIPSCFPRSFFRFGSQQSQPPYRKRIAANTGRPSAKVPPDPLRQTPHERIRVP